MIESWSIPDPDPKHWLKHILRSLEIVVRDCYHRIRKRHVKRHKWLIIIYSIKYVYITLSVED